MTKTFYHPTPDQINLDRVLHALSDPLRRQIIMRLLEAPSSSLCCNKACSVVAPSTLSFHIRILREAGLIHSAKSGTEVLNTVRVKDLEKRFPKLLRTVINHHEPLWSADKAGA